MSGPKFDNGSAFPNHALPHPGMRSLKAGGMGHIKTWKVLEDLKSVGLAGDTASPDVGSREDCGRAPREGFKYFLKE